MTPCSGSTADATTGLTATRPRDQVPTADSFELLLLYAIPRRFLHAARYCTEHKGLPIEPGPRPSMCMKREPPGRLRVSPWDEEAPLEDFPRPFAPVPARSPDDEQLALRVPARVHSGSVCAVLIQRQSPGRGRPPRERQQLAHRATETLLFRERHARDGIDARFNPRSFRAPPGWPSPWPSLRLRIEEPAVLGFLSFAGGCGAEGATVREDQS
jgi:hypothetical protein